MRTVSSIRIARVAAALLPLWIWGCGGPATEASTEQAERSVAIAAVEMVPRDMSLTLEVSGSIEPLREVRIAARMTGIVRELRVEEGDRVAAGAVLARFDVAEQQAELTRARTLFEHADAYYRRAREMRSTGLISEADYERARAEARAAQSEVQLRQTRMALGTVVSPVAGIVTSRSVQAGDAVTSGDPILVVADLSTLVIRVGMSDVHAARLSAGRPVRITVDALPGQRWEGSIRRIFPAADPDSRLHPVEFELDPAPDGRRPAPGYFARVEVDVERRPDVLAVPNEALLTSSDRQSFVFVIENERVRRRPVSTGVSRRDWTEVIEGLVPGELVVGSNPANLREGTLVRVTGRVAHPAEGSS